MSRTKAIHWLGDCTDSGDLWELTNMRPTVVMLGSPTTLYLRVQDGIDVLVPVGWWICDDGDGPYAASAKPRSLSSSTPPSPRDGGVWQPPEHGSTRDQCLYWKPIPGGAQFCVLKPGHDGDHAPAVEAEAMRRAAPPRPEESAMRLTDEALSEWERIEALTEGDPSLRLWTYRKSLAAAMVEIRRLRALSAPPPGDAEAMAKAMRAGIEAWDSGSAPKRKAALDAMLDALHAWDRRNESVAAPPPGEERLRRLVLRDYAARGCPHGINGTTPAPGYMCEPCRAALREDTKETP